MTIDNLIQLNEYLEELDFPPVLNTDDFCSLAWNPATGDYTMETKAAFSEGASLTSTLHFRRAGNTDSFYLEYFVSSLDGLPGGNARKHKFPISFDIGHREAFNLLSGRAVFKRLPKRPFDGPGCWLQINFEEFDGREEYKWHYWHGFDLEKAFDRLPIRDIELGTLKPFMLTSLRKGNQIQVTFQRGRKVEKRLLEAAPSRRIIVIRMPELARGEGGDNLRSQSAFM